MPLEFMTREVFDTLIVLVIIVGAIAAAIRLKKDFTRPLNEKPNWADEDTQEHLYTE